MPNTESAALRTAVDVALAVWRQNLERMDQSFAKLSDDDLQRRVSPDRNRVYYLLGHMVAVHDRLIPLLRLGARQHEDLDQAFLVEADSGVTTVSGADLRAAWQGVNARLATAFGTLQPEQWLERHDSVSPEDFAKEPQRNRLAVLLSRASHLAMHDGQVRLALPKVG